MYFHQVDERDQMQLIDGINARTFWGDRMLCAVVDLDPHAELPNHNHHHEQVGIMLDGEMEMTIAGETRQLQPGDLYVIPGDTEHSARAGAKGARVMDVFSPVREEYQY